MVWITNRRCLKKSGRRIHGNYLHEDHLGRIIKTMIDLVRAPNCLRDT